MLLRAFLSKLPTLSAGLWAVLAFGASAQQASSYDPGQLPSFTGRVQLFTLTPRGDIDGLILVDGTEVKTPPHLSLQMARVFRPGDAVTIHGLKAAKLPLVLALSVTNDRDGTSVVDRGPGPLPVAASREQVEPRLTTGQIRMVLHGVRGEMNGVLMQDGTVLRLPPADLDRMKSVLVPGRTVSAQGNARLTSAGTVIEVTALGASPEQMAPLD